MAMCPKCFQEKALLATHCPHCVQRTEVGDQIGFSLSVTGIVIVVFVVIAMIFFG